MTIKNSNSIKILRSTWFTEMGNPRPIGIVLISTDDERKAFIGTASGSDPKANENAIATRGSQFPLAIAEALLGTQGISDEELMAMP